MERFRSAAGIFGVSLLSVLAELAFTRILSTVLWYDVVYLVVSLAVCGLGLGALLAAHSGWVTRKNRAGWTVGLAAALAGAGALVYSYPWPAQWAGYLVFVAVPFVLAGALLASLFRQESGAGFLYFADLTAAGLASLLAVPLLDRLGGVGLLSATVFGALILAVVFAGQARTRRTALVAVVVLVAAAAAAPLTLPRFPLPLARGGIVPEKTLYRALTEDGGRIVHSRWDSFSRTDVVRAADGQSLSLFTDGGAGSRMYRFDGDLQQVSFLTADNGFLPFTWGPHGRVLVIGPGGGKDVLVSLLGGAEQITAVEVSPGVIEAAHRYAGFNGRLFDRRNVRLVAADGRAYLERNRGRFDLIYLPLVVSQTADGSGSLSENYLLTRESLSTYLTRLAPGGRLVVKVHDQAEALRAFLLALAALQDRGESTLQAAQHLLLVNGGEDDHGHGGLATGVMFPALVIQRERFNSAQLDGIRTTAGQLQQKLLFVPGGQSNGLPGALATGQVTLAQVQRAVPLRLEIPTDDRPFFYESAPGLPPAVRELVVLALVVCLAVTLLAGSPRTGFRWIYFAALGTAFMLVEVGLIQRGRLFLGQPTEAVAIVLLGLLAGGGLGSLLSTRLSHEGRLRRLRALLGLLSLVILMYGLGLSRLYGALSRTGWAGSPWAALALVAPLGLLMGMPFPAGLSLLWAGEAPEREVPRMMAINGAFSVLGSALGLALALTAGYTATFTAGAVAYGALALVLPLVLG